MNTYEIALEQHTVLTVVIQAESQEQAERYALMNAAGRTYTYDFASQPSEYRVIELVKS